MAAVAESEEFMLSKNHSHLLNRGTSSPMAGVTVGAGTTLREVAEAIDFDYRELKNLNTSLRYGFVPPYERLALFKENYTRKNPDEKYVVYVVRPGDTLTTIGQKFGLNYQVIMDFNDIRRSFIKPGQKLVIPVEKPTRREYVVQNGDTLYSIAQKFNVPLQRLKDLNNLKYSTIYVGHKLIIQK